MHIILSLISSSHLLQLSGQTKQFLFPGINVLEKQKEQIGFKFSPKKQYSQPSPQEVHVLSGLRV